MNDDERYQRARRRVEAVRGFYVHLVVYLIVNAGLFLINMLTSPGTLWFYWPLIGWGIGVAAHAFSVFGAGKWLGPEWEEREIRKILDKGERR